MDTNTDSFHIRLTMRHKVFVTAKSSYVCVIVLVLLTQGDCSMRLFAEKVEVVLGEHLVAKLNDLPLIYVCHEAGAI